MEKFYSGPFKIPIQKNETSSEKPIWHFHNDAHLSPSTLAYLSSDTYWGTATDTFPEEDLPLYKNRAKQGDPEAQYWLGHCYEQGLYVPQSYKKAYEYYRCSSDQGNLNATVRLAYLIMRGCGVSQSYSDAHVLLERAAKRGSGWALNSLAECYEYGKGVPISYRNAIRYYEQAIQNGFKQAYTALTTLYVHCGKKKLAALAVEEALCAYQTQVQEENPKALVELGRLLKGSPDSEYLSDRAFHCFLSAAKKQYTPALWWLALCYEEGYGVTQSDEKALDYYKLASERGLVGALFDVAMLLNKRKRHQEAYHYLKAFSQLKRGFGIQRAMALKQLGYYHRTGLGVTQNLETATQYYAKAFSEFKSLSDNGDALAQYELGDCYRYGLGVQHLPLKAYSHYLLAAQNGVPEAFAAIGDCYRNGEGVEQSEEQALNYYILAGKKGYVEGLFLAGILLYHKPCYKKAIQYFRKFLKVRSDDSYERALASSKLAKCLEGGLGIRKSVHKARYYYQRAFDQFKSLADQGEACAQEKVAECFRYGLGVIPSFQTALRYYKEAAAQKHPWACYELATFFESGKGVDKSLEEAIRYFQIAADNGIDAAIKRLKGCIATLEKPPKREELATNCNQNDLSDNLEVTLELLRSGRLILKHARSGVFMADEKMRALRRLDTIAVKTSEGLIEQAPLKFIPSHLFHALAFGYLMKCVARCKVKIQIEFKQHPLDPFMSGSGGEDSRKAA